jgi:16S rRNA (guanine527-N7)-methyltransferase
MYNRNNMDNVDTIRDLLSGDGLILNEECAALLHRYMELISVWNDRLSLVSQGDLSHLWHRHVVDALSLAPYVSAYGGREGGLLDIGSGSGFPAIPLLILLDDLQATLVERGERKAEFLELVLRELRPAGVQVLCDQFPVHGGLLSPGAITARAVDKPQRLLRGLAREIAHGATFLCQNLVLAESLGELFHVEHIEDDWTRHGLRRGQFWIIHHEEVSN